jgi:diaminohydroxyphosphoribosylaminopyrimidine deaminase/5-amino-6-(5-phosphoribosylamino)uracil reductase
MMPRVHTVVVTLEPCNHVGRTPPCCEAIINAGIRRVIVGARDPNPDVGGGGCERLRSAGIEVIEGIETEACRRLIYAFAFYALHRRPFVTVKRAFDSFGSMIPPPGEKTFTSKESLVLAHRLRKKADAIVTGSGTILADNPLFNVRHVEDHEGKRRILAILDRRGRVSRDYMDRAAQRGLDVIIYQDLDTCFSDLAGRGVLDVLVEAGPLLSQSVIDSSYWTMCVDILKGQVDILKGQKDSVALSFNPKEEIPFSTQRIEIDCLLPF